MATGVPNPAAPSTNTPKLKAINSACSRRSADNPTTEFFTRDGDFNQEDLTNDSVAVWAGMHCWHFSLTDNPSVNHFELPGNAGVLARLVANANAPRSNCG